MRRILAITLLTLTACVAPQTTQALLVSRHSVLIDMPSGSGSGFPITEDVILTAWHVVVGEKPEDVTVNGAPAQRIIQLGDLDAALIYMQTPHGLTPWPVEDRALKPGEIIYKSGYGLGDHRWGEGLGSDVPELVTLAIAPGDSGGPVFDADGDVVGIIVLVDLFRGQIITHQCEIVPMTLIVPELPADLYHPAPAPLPAPVPALETWWDRFLRLREELGV